MCVLVLVNMCAFTRIYDICVLIHIYHICVLIHTCRRRCLLVSSARMCVLVLPCVRMLLYYCYMCVVLLYMCPHTAVCVLVLLYMSSHAYMRDRPGAQGKAPSAHSTRIHTSYATYAYLHTSYATYAYLGTLYAHTYLIRYVCIPHMLRMQARPAAGSQPKSAPYATYAYLIRCACRQGPRQAANLKVHLDAFEDIEEAVRKMPPV